MLDALDSLRPEPDDPDPLEESLEEPLEEPLVPVP